MYSSVTIESIQIQKSDNFCKQKTGLVKTTMHQLTATLLEKLFSPSQYVQLLDHLSTDVDRSLSRTIQRPIRQNAAYLIASTTNLMALEGRVVRPSLRSLPRLWPEQMNVKQVSPFLLQSVPQMATARGPPTQPSQAKR